MKKIPFNFTRHLLTDFYRNEQGVYAMLTALVSFALLGTIALSVDGSGMLLDKARFSQGLEQGALALIAESNDIRDDDLSANIYRNLKDNEPESKDFKKHEGKTSEQIRSYKRNQQLLKGYVKSYLPLAELPRDFTYECITQAKPKKTANCYASGDMVRRSWLPLSNTSLTFDPTVKISSEEIYVGKNLDDRAPLDLVLVTDLSGSMGYDVNGATKGQSKISILQDVIGMLGDEMLDNTEGREDVSPYNRFRFASFSFGSSQENENTCTLPYELTSLTKQGLFSTTRKYNYCTYDNKTKNCAKGSIKEEWLTVYEAWQLLIQSSSTVFYNGYSSMDVAKQFIDLLNNGIDYSATVASVKTFDGSKRNYQMSPDKHLWCLWDNKSVATTSNKWYSKGQSSSLKADFNKIKASGSTLSSSGLINGANLLMQKSDVPAAQPDKLLTNTQRILLVLSDGKDEVGGSYPALNITNKVIDAGVCDAIRNQVDTLQDKDYTLLKTEIHFVAFGYILSGDQKKAWVKCVGGDNRFHDAANKDQLIKVFRKIANLEEEVGHISPTKNF